MSASKMALIFLPKPMFNIALMTAIFSAAVPIHRDALPAKLTSNLVVCLAVDLVEMLIPPLISTLVAAESPQFLSGILLNRATAVFAFCYNGWGFWFRLFLGFFLSCLLFLFLCYVLHRTELRKFVFLNAVINHMHLCRSVIVDHNMVDNQRNVLFI